MVSKTGSTHISITIKQRIFDVSLDGGRKKKAPVTNRHSQIKRQANNCNYIRGWAAAVSCKCGEGKYNPHLTPRSIKKQKTDCLHVSLSNVLFFTSALSAVKRKNFVLSHFLLWHNPTRTTKQGNIVIKDHAFTPFDTRFSGISSSTWYFFSLIKCNASFIISTLNELYTI